MSQAPTRPPLQWFGGKWRLAPWIVAQLPPHRRYVEPFGGAAGVLLRKPPSHHEIYNDLDGEICNLFRVLRDPLTAGALCRLIELTPYAREELLLAYEPSSDPVERARRLLIRGHLGMGSDGATRSYRTGFKAGKANAGSNARSWANLPPELERHTRRLANVVIEQEDAFTLLRRYDGPATLFYIDPPYPFQARKAAKAKHGYRHELTDQQHAALAQMLHGLRGMVVLSGYACDLYAKLFPDWQQRSAIAYDYGANERREVLWFNHAAAAAAPHPKPSGRKAAPVALEIPGDQP